MLLRISSLITPRKGIIYWNLQRHIPLGWVNHFICLGKGELCNLYWDPIVLVQAGPIEMHYLYLEWNTNH